MELIQAWLTIIGAGTVIYGAILLGVYLYDEDQRRHPKGPSVFHPWRKT